MAVARRASGHEPNFRGPALRVRPTEERKKKKKAGRAGGRDGPSGKETFFLGGRSRERGSEKEREGTVDVSVMFSRRSRARVFYIKLRADAGRPIAKRTP